MHKPHVSLNTILALTCWVAGLLMILYRVTDDRAAGVGQLGLFLSALGMTLTVRGFIARLEVLERRAFRLGQDSGLAPSRPVLYSVEVDRN